MKKVFCFLIISILANYHISTLFAQVPTAPGSYQWVKGFGSFNQVSGQDEQIRAMKFDNSGNIVVCGRNMGYSYIQGLGGKKDTMVNNRWQNSNNFHGYISKYDCNGNLLWYKELNDSINNTDIYDFVIDSLDNIYFLGSCPLGMDNIYFGDSLIQAWSFNPAFLGPPVLSKLDKNGYMKWLWAQPSGLADVYILEPGHAPQHNGTINPNTMVLMKDTIHLLCFAGASGGPITINGVTTNAGINITRFTTAGKLVDASLLHINNNPVNGFGIDKDGTYLASVNFYGTVSQFLDSTFSRPTATQFNPLSTIIKFNRHHVIRHIETGDTTYFYRSDFSNLVNGFNCYGGGFTGKKIYGNMVLPTKSTDVIQSSGGNFHFENITNLTWNSCLDTATYSGGWEYGTSDVNGDVYVNANIMYYMKYKNFIDYTNGSYYKSFPLKLSKLNGSPIFRYDSLHTLFPQVYNNAVQFQDFGISPNGNLIISGNLKNNRVIVGTDTAKYYGGNNDMFVMRYGNPCSNAAPMIAAGTPSGLLAACNGKTSIHLKWDLVKNGEDKYYIYRSLAANSGFVKIDSVAPNTNTYTDVNVVLNTNYWYAISSHNIVGEGYLSMVDSARLCDDIGGISNLNSTQLAGQLYPNPTTGEFNLFIQSSEINAIAQLQISNYVGQVILNKTVSLKNSNNFKLDVSDYAGGIYLVTLKTAQSRYSEKLILVK